jgi:hypothetical protein
VAEFRIITHSFFWQTDFGAIVKRRWRSMRQNFTLHNSFFLQAHSTAMERRRCIAARRHLLANTVHRSLHRRPFSASILQVSYLYCIQNNKNGGGDALPLGGIFWLIPFIAPYVGGLLALTILQVSYLYCMQNNKNGGGIITRRPNLHS